MLPDVCRGRFYLVIHFLFRLISTTILFKVTVSVTLRPCSCEQCAEVCELYDGV
jgi:hypothetical protein